MDPRNRATLAGLLLSGLALGACKGDEKTPAPVADKATSAEASQAAVQAETPPSAPKESPDLSGIHWHHDDYAAALAQAKEEKKPLVIDMWAAWCHSCLAMKHGVLRDAALAEHSERFVWLALDTEKESSAEAMAKYPVKAWPTFFVVAPGDESIQATQVGSTSVGGFRDFILRGEAGHRAMADQSGALDEGSAEYALRQADRAMAKGEHKEAAKHFATALERAPKEWSLRGSVLTSYISTLKNADMKEQCATVATKELESLATVKTASVADFIYYLGECAKVLDEDAKGELLRRGLFILDALLSAPDAALSNDDRSEALATSRRLALELGMKEAAKTYALQQRALLNDAVAAAQSPMDEMTYIWHQVEVHDFLQDHAAILPWVESVERRLPKEYDPPYRKAWLLLKMGKLTEASASVERALELSKGARRGRILGLGAAIHKAAGDKDKERAARQAVLAHYESLPDGQRSQKSIDGAKKALAEMDAPPKPAE